MPSKTFKQNIYLFFKIGPPKLFKNLIYLIVYSFSKIGPPKLFNYSNCLFFCQKSARPNCLTIVYLVGQNRPGLFILPLFIKKKSVSPLVRNRKGPIK